MSRNLVLCFDGTGDKYAVDNTNVVKLYAMLDHTEPDQREPDQRTYYHAGIGTLLPVSVWEKGKRWVLDKLGLATAWMLQTHVTDGYRFLMHYYRPGDRIFLFGFSRGAYTARVLAGMLHKVGLVTAGNDQMVPFAWHIFKHGKNEKTVEGFRKTFSRPAPVHFIGVWDTVSTVGWIWDPQSFPFTASNPSVSIVRHAISLDERRVFFSKNLWETHPDVPTDVVQEWFAGVHCDVGGGYAEQESGLSKITLRWMVEHAKEFGLRIDAQAEVRIIPQQNTHDHVAPSVTAMLHESLHGWWWIPEYLPRIRKLLTHAHVYWIFHRGRHRYVAPGSLINRTVYERMQRVPSYAPPNLPVEGG